MRRISLALALVGAFAAAGCGGASNKSSNPTGSTGDKGVAEGTFSIVIQNGQNNSPGLAITGGYITSSPAALDCGVAPHGVCSASFATDSRVVLTAVPSTGKLFLGWAGDCAGLQTTCTISGQAADQYVVALFGTEADRTGHPNWSEGTVHGPQAAADLTNATGALKCASCHGRSLEGSGLAVSCAGCHFGSSQVVAPATVARGERCSDCHQTQGSVHQGIYAKYTDASTLLATIDSVNVTSNIGPNGFKTVVAFSLRSGTTPLTLTQYNALKQKRFSGTKYDTATDTFETATAISFDTKTVATTATAGQFTVTAAKAPFDLKAAGTNAFLYFYFGDKLLVPAEGNYNLMDNVASVSSVIGTIDYSSTATVSGCERCHGVPYMKHGYRAAKVAGLADFVACKACHHDQRAGTDFDWQVLANDPAMLASLTANGLASADWNTGAGTITKQKYRYIANVMNDTHMSHAMEFAYPQSMANCSTCHAGALDRVLTDENFTAQTCRSCHPIYATTDDAKRAPSFKGPKLGPALAYHNFDWAGGGVFEYDPATDTTTTEACNTCHNATWVAPWDGVTRAPRFAQLHNGYNSAISNAATGAKWSGTIATVVDSVAYDPATHQLTANFTMNGLDAGAIVKPTLVVSLYGYGTKDFVISGHSSQFADKTPNLEWAEGATVRNSNPPVSANTNRLTVTPAVAAAGARSWSAVADLTTWDAIIGTTVLKAEIAFLPQVGLDQTVAPQCDATKAAYNQCIAVKGITATVDLATGLQDNAMYGKNIVDTAKCDKCHDALAVEFHSPNYGSAGVSACRLCHFVGTGGSHLEMQSRSIDSYVHAIHAFQKMDINTVNFADPVQAMEYRHHIESTYPNFTTLSCESCHNPGTYDIADQSLSLSAILSGSSTLTGAGRAIQVGIPSVVTGPSAKACGGCHRAMLIKADDAAGLNAYDSHTKAFGYRETAASSSAIATLWNAIIDAIFP
jgi:hypothetical protein